MSISFEQENNEDIKITPDSLYKSVLYFKSIFVEKHKSNPLINGFKIVDKIDGDFITDYTKSFSKNIDNTVIKEEDIDKAIESEKPHKGLTSKRDDIIRRPVCWVIEIPIVHPLGIVDHKYYYIVYRKKWFNRWANIYYKSTTRYFNKEGITIVTDILKNSLCCYNKTNINKISTLVFVTTDGVYYIPMEEVFKLSRKIGIFTDKWNQVCVGIPRSSFLLEDPTKYDKY